MKRPAFLVACVLAFAAFGAALLACSALVTFDGLTGGVVSDASTSQKDGSTTVTLADGNVIVVGDASATDGGISPVVTDGGFCAENGTGATFCDDFDTLPFGATWTSTETGGDIGILALYDAGYTSAPYSAQIGYPNVPATGGGDSVGLFFNYPALATQVKARYDVAVTKVSGLDAYATLTVNVGDENISVSLCPGNPCGKTGTSGFIYETAPVPAASCTQATDYYDGTTCYRQHPLTLTVGQSSFMTVVFTLTLSPATASVTINGVNVSSGAVTLQSPWTPGSPGIFLGAGYEVVGDTSQIALFDNVRLDVK